MMHFAEQNPEKYVQVILENSCKRLRFSCPFVTSSLAIVKLLCDTFCLQPENDEVSVIDRKSIYMKMTFETNEVLEVSLKIYTICH